VQQHISEKRSDLVDRIKDKDSEEIAKIIIRNDDNKPTLTIEKKAFNLHDRHDSFFNTNTKEVCRIGAFEFLQQRLTRFRLSRV
jgi:hypothetical protein